MFLKEVATAFIISGTSGVPELLTVGNWNVTKLLRTEMRHGTLGKSVTRLGEEWTCVALDPCAGKVAHPVVMGKALLGREGMMDSASHRRNWCDENHVCAVNCKSCSDWLGRDGYLTVPRRSGVLTR